MLHVSDETLAEIPASSSAPSLEPDNPLYRMDQRVLNLAADTILTHAERRYGHEAIRPALLWMEQVPETKPRRPFERVGGHQTARVKRALALIREAADELGMTIESLPEGHVPGVDADFLPHAEAFG